MSSDGILPAVADAVRRYASYLRSDNRRRRGLPSGVMSPMDEMTWFEFAKETPLAPGVTPVYTPVVTANPMRVGLIFSCNVAGPMFFTTNPNASGSQGMSANNTTNPIILIQCEHGILTQSAWFMTSAVAGTVGTVIELLLRDWPGR